MPNEVFIPVAGALIAERYQLRRVIGSGGMGQVWEAYDQQLESPCAIKFILEHMARDAGVRSRFAREARAVAALRSPHAVQILGIGEHGDALYIAMELLEGETLRARLNRTGRLDEATALAMLQQVGHALEKARLAGIVHRDLKPENIWLGAEHDIFAKILDFGVAKSLLPSNSLQTATGALLGTPYYMSPEQARGNHDVDHRSDLWSLAIIAVECLGGRRPYQSEGLGDLLVKILTAPPPPLAEVAPHLPAAVGAWWEKALARRPEQRFQTAPELVESLRACFVQAAPRARPKVQLATSYESSSLFGSPLVAGSVSPVSGSPPARPQRRRLGFALGAVALFLGLVTAWRLSMSNDAGTGRGGPAAAAVPAVSPSPSPSPSAVVPQAGAADPPSTARPSIPEPRANVDAPVVVRPITEAPLEEREKVGKVAPPSDEEDALFVGEARTPSVNESGAPKAATRPPKPPARPASRHREPRSPTPRVEPAAAQPAPAAKPAAPTNDYGF